MGTNYYFYEKADCPTCGHSVEPVHIGKSSAGWCFSLRVFPEEDINTLDDWKSKWETPGAHIKNEYGDAVSFDEMMEIITQRGRSDSARKMDAEWYERNHAKPGPDNLARHNGYHCIGHGEGTWDYISGEFS